MNGQRATDDDVRRPALVVQPCGLVAVSAIDEKERQRRAPTRRDRRRLAHDGEHHVLEVGVMDGVAERRQRVHLSRARVDNRGVVMLPPGLVLLTAAVMIDSEYDGACRPRRTTEPHG